jgi:hypothetical protein
MASAQVTDQSDANNAAVAVTVNARLRMGYSWRFIAGTEAHPSRTMTINLLRSWAYGRPRGKHGN